MYELHRVAAIVQVSSSARTEPCHVHLCGSSSSSAAPPPQQRESERAKNLMVMLKKDQGRCKFTQ